MARAPSSGFASASSFLADSDGDLSTRSLSPPSFPQSLPVSMGIQVALAQPAISEHGELLVEVVRGEGLTTSDYRIGDIAGTLLGLRRLRPYVRVVAPTQGLGAACQSSSFGRGQSWRTSPAAANAQGRADFSELGAFPLLSSTWGCGLSGLQFQIQVYDQRGIQAWLRGDPLIGEGTLELSEDVLGNQTEKLVTLRSRSGERRGSVTLRAGLRASNASFMMLTETRGKSLAKVAAALAQVMAQPGSTDRALEARPEVLKTLPVRQEREVKRMLKSWVVRFCKLTSVFTGKESDQQAILYLARLARSAQDIVATCVWWDDDQTDIQSLTVAWLERLFAASAGDIELPVQLDEARLRWLLRAHATGDGDPRLGLLELGARELPQSLSEEAVTAVWCRVAEAMQAEEEEIFTCSPLVVDGRLARGLAAVLRPNRSGGLPHVFLYHAESIRKWQAREHTDPTTRETLREPDILPLS